VSDYPILVERYGPGQSDRVVCEYCHEESMLDPSEGDPYDMCLECACGGPLVWKYDEADKCPGCGKLGFYDYPLLQGCCSRRCRLVAEYAATLHHRGAA
jgi:hypothetical protein